MRKILIVLYFLSTPLVFGQEHSGDRFFIPKEDSIILHQQKVLVSQLINPKPDSALYHIKKIAQLSIDKDYILGKAESYYLYATYYRRMQKIDTAIFYYDRLLDLSNKENYIKGKGLAYNGLCRLNYSLGKLDVAIQACLDCLKLQDLLKDGLYTIVPDTHIALASAYIRKNELQPAIRNLLLVDSLHNVTPLRPEIIAAAFQSLGNIYTNLKEYTTAEVYYIKANEEFKKLPQNAAAFYMQTTNRHLGEVYYYQGNFEQADSLLTSSRAFFATIKDERTLAEINTALGLLHIETNDYEKAESFLDEALELNKKNNFDYEASQSGIELAKLFLLKEQASKAITTLEDVLEFNKGNKNSGFDQQVYELLSHAYAQQKKYDQAYENLQKATGIKDSLSKVQSAEKIKEIEGIYQTEKRDREIELLTSKNELAEQQKTNQRNIMLAGLVLTSFAGIFFFFQWRTRKKTHRKLKELDAAKSTFFANISHEFRTPLTLIKGPLEDQLRDERLIPSQRRNLMAAQSNTLRLESLVDQLLALSKLESGNLKLQVQPGNLPQFIAAQAEAFSFSAGEKQIDFKVTLKKDERVDWFDRDALSKILFNLIGNAIKYSPDAGNIEVFGTRSKNIYNFAITNTSEDLTPEEREKIFERFYQTNSKNRGAGIGLALTKELVELHGGVIFMPNTNPGFTSFAIEIPTSKSAYKSTQILLEELQQIEQTPLIISEEITDAAIVPSEDAPIVLIVDDNIDIRNYIASIFENTFEVHTAIDGKEGFDSALEIIPDIIISDVMMPEVDGLAFAKMVKEHELTFHIPVILLTAKTEETHKLQGLETGADAYITKPFNSQFLLGSANNLLENRRTLQQRFAQEVILKPKDISISSADEKFIERLQTVFDKQLTNPEFSAEQFGREMGVSRMQLHRKLKALTGQSTTEFIRSQRLKLASQLLKENNAYISEIGYTVGFNNPSYFTKCFKQEFGTSPSEYISASPKS
jgi:signal transduction histidine kinase/DNA-binding response OmpR family regulator